MGPASPRDQHRGGQDVTALELFGAGYRARLGQVLERVYPGWPDAVQRYRVHRMSLEDMYAQVVGETVDVFTILVTPRPRA